MTQPIFIIGCGRSGTQALARMLNSHTDVTMQHEYMVHLIQPLGCDYAMGHADHDTVVQEMKRTYGSAVHYADTPFWGDSSNKLAWLIGPLLQVLPTARIVHIVRDGRNVCSSLYHKLGAECLDDRSSHILRAYYASPDKHMRPPPEKPYWWPQARLGQPDNKAYQSYDQFQRICYHWVQINAEIERGLANIPASQWQQYRLEDITGDTSTLDEMADFLGLKIGPDQHALMAKPHNVVRPTQYGLSEAQNAQFWEIAGPTMAKYGYQMGDDHSVDYKSQEQVS